MSFFTNQDKFFLSSELDKVAKSFERPITISLEAKKAIISTNPNFNRFQANDQNLISQNPENVPTLYTVMARVLYEKQQPVNYSQPYVGGSKSDAQAKLVNQEGRVRIKMDMSGAALLKDARLVELDGTPYNIDSSNRLHGLFTGDYCTIYLMKSS